MKYLREGVFIIYRNTKILHTKITLFYKNIIILAASKLVRMYSNYKRYVISCKPCRSSSFFLIGIVGGGVQLGPLGTAATNRRIVPAPGDYDDGEIGGMIGTGNRSTRRKPAPVPLCPPQNPHAARKRSRTTAVGSQRLTA
jgi:hypothetical protein